MTRQYNPFINPATGTLECLYAACGREIPPDLLPAAPGAHGLHARRKPLRSLQDLPMARLLSSLVPPLESSDYVVKRLAPTCCRMA